MRHKIAILFFGLIFFYQNVNADDFYSNCKKAISTMQMMSCSQSLLTQYNNTLNKMYSDILHRLSSKKTVANFGGPKVVQKIKQSLLQSQKSWVSYQSHYCASIYYLNIEGSDRNLMRIGCELSITKDRIRELKHFYP